MGNIKKVQNHEHHDPEENSRNRRNSQYWKWPQTGYEQHQTGRRGGKEKI